MNLINSIILSTDIIQLKDIIGKPSEYKPIINDNNQFYLYRYWLYQTAIFQQILNSKANILTSISSTDFTDNSDEIQKSIINILKKYNYCFITGGPGTGKTTQIKKIINYFLNNNKKINIAVVAPTGKATYRIQEILNETNMNNQLTMATIHRILKAKNNLTDFEHNENNPLPYQLIIIDEASMIDLPLMYQLIKSAKNSSLIFLGDKNQLGPVNSISLFNQICNKPETQHLLINLTKNYRFKANPDLIKINNALLKSDTKELCQLLKTQNNLATNPRDQANQNPAKKFNSAVLPRIFWFKK